MRRVHLIVGLAGVAVFVGSGQYMQRAQTFLYDDPTRLLYRSAHIYLLLASLLNLALGLYLPESPRGWRRWVRHLGSVLLLAAPPLMAMAFWAEPWLTDLARPYSRPGNSVCLAGMVLHTVTAVRWRLGAPTAINEGTAATAADGATVRVVPPARPQRSAAP